MSPGRSRRTNLALGAVAMLTGALLAYAVADQVGLSVEFDPFNPKQTLEAYDAQQSQQAQPTEEPDTPTGTGDTSTLTPIEGGSLRPPVRDPLRPPTRSPTRP